MTVDGDGEEDGTFTWRVDDPAWVDALFGRLYGPVLAMVRASMGERLRASEESVDIVQNVLMNFWRYLPRFEFRSEEQLLGFCSQLVDRNLRTRFRHFTAAARDRAREADLGPDCCLFFADQPLAGRTPSSIIAESEERARLAVGRSLLLPEQQLLLRPWPSR